MEWGDFSIKDFQEIPLITNLMQRLVKECQINLLRMQSMYILRSMLLLFESSIVVKQPADCGLISNEMGN